MIIGLHLFIIFVAFKELKPLVANGGVNLEPYFLFLNEFFNEVGVHSTNAADSMLNLWLFLIAYDQGFTRRTFGTHCTKAALTLMFSKQKVFKFWLANSAKFGSSAILLNNEWLKLGNLIIALHM